MTRNEATHLALKLAGLYAALEGLTYMHSALYTSVQYYRIVQMKIPNRDWAIFVYSIISETIIFLLLFGLAYLLLFRTSRFMPCLFKEWDAIEDDSPTATPRDWQSMAIYLIGLICVLWALPHAIYEAISLFLLSEERNSPSSEITPADWSRWASLAFEGIVLLNGLILMRSCHGIAARWWQKRAGETYE